MEPKSFNSTTILILTIGLVIGSLGSHIILRDNYQKTQENTQRNIQALNNTIQNINNNINNIAYKIEQLESKASSLNTKVDVNEYMINDISSYIDYIDHRIDLIEEKYEVLVEENEENLQQINDKDEHISHLYRELGVSDGYKLYLDHDVKFEYPEEMNISEQGLRMKDATSIDGLVSGTITKEEHIEMITTVWEYDVLGYYKENILTELDNLASVSHYGFEETQIGEVMETSHLGHVVYYKDFTGTLNNETIHGRIGAWLCTQEKRFHALLVFTDTEDHDEIFMKYLDSFRCHK